LRRDGKGHAEAVPRHSEIANVPAKRIYRKLSIPTRPANVIFGRISSQRF
jgi:hypothetical protein